MVPENPLFSAYLDKDYTIMQENCSDICNNYREEVGIFCLLSTFFYHLWLLGIGPF